MIARVTLFGILLAGLAAATGFTLAGAWQLGAPAVGLAGLWIVARRKGWGGASSPLLLGFIVLAALGTGLRGGAIWTPLCLTAALAAWDLDRFAGRLADSGLPSADAGIDERAAADAALARRHLARLGGVVGLGLALSWASQALRFKLDLTVMLLLGFVAILGLSRLVRSLVRESD